MRAKWVYKKSEKGFFEEKESRCATCLSTHEQPAKISEETTICHEFKYMNQITTDCLILQFESLIFELMRDLSMEIMIDIKKISNSCNYFRNREKRCWNRKFLWQNQKHKRWCQRWIFKASNFFPVSDNLNFSLPCFSAKICVGVPEAFTPVSLRINPYLEVGLHNTILAMKAFCLRNNLSDRSASDLHSLFDAFLSENCFPSKFAFIKDLKRSFQRNTSIAVETPGGYLCVMSFGYDIAQTDRRNWQTMVMYSSQRHSKFKHLDFSLNKVPPIDLVQPLITINLVLSTDGFPMGLRFRFYYWKWTMACMACNSPSSA